MAAGNGLPTRTVTPRPATGNGGGPSLFAPPSWITTPPTPPAPTPKAAPNVAPFKPGFAPSQVAQQPASPVRDPKVVALQTQLNAMGYHVAVDGIMGPETQAALFLSHNATVRNAAVRTPVPKPPASEPVLHVNGETQANPLGTPTVSFFRPRLAQEGVAPHKPEPISEGAVQAAMQIEKQNHPDLAGSPNVLRQLAILRLTGHEASSPALQSLLGQTTAPGQQEALAKFKFEQGGGTGGAVLSSLVAPFAAATGANIVAKLARNEPIHVGDVVSTVGNAALTVTGQDVVRSLIGAARGTKDAIAAGEVIHSASRAQLEAALRATPGIAEGDIPHIMQAADTMAHGVAEAHGIPVEQVFGNMESHFVNVSPTEGDLAAGAHAQIAPMHETPAERVAANQKQKLNPRNAEKGLPVNDVVAPKSGVRMFGQPTHQEWIDRVLKYTPDAGQRAQDAAWYTRLEPEFRRVFGKDWQPIMRGFLASQANAGPADGLASTLHALEKLGRMAPIGTGPEHGIGSIVADAIAKTLAGEKLTSGQAAKLSDFIDSARGKVRRTWMGNLQAAGEPAAGDIWSGRDLGYIDSKIANESVKGRGATLKSHIMREHGIDMSQLAPEYGGTLSGNRYERVSEFYNSLADHLNKIGFDGRDNWKASEVQALGWMNMQRVYGRRPQEIHEWIASALDKFQRKVARAQTVEAERHIGSPSGVHLVRGSRKDIMEMPPNPKFLYHGTNAEGANGILTSGRIEARPTERYPEQPAAWLTEHPARAAMQGDHVIAIPRGNVEHQLNAHALGMYSSLHDVHIHGNPLDETTAMVHSEAVPQADLHPQQNARYNRLDWNGKTAYAHAVDNAITDGHFERIVGLDSRGAHYGVGVWRGEANPGIATHYAVTDLNPDEVAKLNALSAAQGMAKEQGSVSWGRPVSLSAKGDNVFPAVVGTAPQNPETLAKLGALVDEQFGNGMIGVIHGPHDSVYLVDFHGNTQAFTQRAQELLGSSVHEIKWQGGYTIDERLKTEPWETTFQQAIKDAPNADALQQAVDHVHAVVQKIQQKLFTATPATMKYEGMLLTHAQQLGHDTSMGLTAGARSDAEESLHAWADANPQSPYAGQFKELYEAHIAEQNSLSPDMYFNKENPLMGSIQKAQGARQYLQAGGRTVKGATLLHDGKATLFLFRQADASTALHELAHVFQDALPSELKATIRDPEHWARSFEQYIAHGQAPSSEMQPMFDSLANTLRNIYGVADAIPGADLTGEMRHALDRFFLGKAQHDEGFARMAGASWFHQAAFSDNRNLPDNAGRGGPKNLGDLEALRKSGQLPEDHTVNPKALQPPEGGSYTPALRPDELHFQTEYTPSRDLAYHDLLVHPRPARSAISRAVIDKPWDATSTRLEKIATKLREDNHPLAKAAGKALTPFTTRSRVPRIAAKNFVEDMNRVRANAHGALHTLNKLDTRLGLHALNPGEGEGIAHYWWAQLPKAERNAAGLKKIQDALLKEYQYVSDPHGAFADLHADLAELEASRPSGEDVTASEVFAHLSEEAKIKQRIADIPDIVSALQRNITKLERVIQKPPQLSEEALHSISQLMDERKGILMAAGVLKPEVAAEREGLVARYLGMQPDGSEIYVGHRAGDLSRGASFPRGASFGGTRTPRGAARGHRNEMVLFRHGMLQQSMESIVKDWAAAQGYQAALRAKNDLARLGEPVMGYLKPDHVLVNPNGQRVPRAIHTDPEAQAQSEGLNINDLTELQHNLFAETTPEQQRMMEAARQMGNLHELRQVPKDVAAKYYEAILGKRASVATPGIRPEGLGTTLGKALDVVTNSVYMSLIYTNPGYVPSILMQNMVFAGLHQGAFLPQNLYRAGKLLAHGPKDVADLIKGEVGVGALEGIAAGKDTNITHSFIRHIHTIPDTWPRTAAFLHEMARNGIVKKFGALDAADYNAIRDLFRNPAKVEQLRELANYARQSQVDFNRLRPTEQALARRLLFVWPWIRGISAWPFRFALDHPIRTAALAAYIGAGANGMVPFPKLVTKDVPTWLQESFATGHQTIQGKSYPTVMPTRYINPASTPIDLFETLTGAPGAAVVNSLLNPIIGAGWHVGNKEDRFGHASASYWSSFLSNLESLVPNYALAKDLVNPPDIQHAGLYPGDTSRLGRIERALRIFPFPYDPTQALKDAEKQGLKGNLTQVHETTLIHDSQLAGLGTPPKYILQALDHRTALDHISGTHKGVNAAQDRVNAAAAYYKKVTGTDAFGWATKPGLPTATAQEVYLEIRAALIDPSLSSWEASVKASLAAQGEQP